MLAKKHGCSDIDAPSRCLEQLDRMFSLRAEADKLRLGQRSFLFPLIIRQATQEENGLLTV